MLPTTSVTDVFELFRKVLSMMIENGILKSYTFVYEENTPFLTLDKFLVNAVNILDELKELLLKLCLEFIQWNKHGVEMNDSFYLYTYNDNSPPDIQNNVAFAISDTEGIISGSNTVQYELLNDSVTNNGLQTVSIQNDDFTGCNNKITPSFMSQLADAVSLFDSNDGWNPDNIVQVQTRESVLHTPPLEQMQYTDFLTDSTIKSELNENILFSCDKCGEFFDNRRQLGIHLIREHKGIEVDNLDEDTYKLSTDLVKDETFFGKYLDPESTINNVDSGRETNDTAWIESSTLSLSSPRNSSDFDMKTPELQTETESQIPFDVSDSLSDASQDPCQQFINNISSLVCEHCGDFFSSEQNLTDHIVAEHNKNTNNAIGCSENKCEQCNKSFATQLKLKFHMKSHDEPMYECNVCQKKFLTAAYLSSHRKRHEPFQTCEVNCFKCEMVFNSKQNLMKHLQIDHNGARIPCQMADCNASFTSYNTLNQHVKWKHMHNEKVKCDICGVELSRRACLIRHKRQVHSNMTNGESKDTRCSSPKFPCDVCEKSFQSKEVLKQHMNTHSDHKRFSCLVCGALFATNSNLRIHLTIHKEDAPDKNFQCDKCAKKFKTNSSLKFHTKMHDGLFRFKCEFCGKQFVRKCHYETHRLTHSTERPFKCAQCASAFKTPKHLRDHAKRVHKTVRTILSFSTPYIEQQTQISNVVNG